MDKTRYKALEDYMLSQMCDVAHGCDHVYRVLYTALDIARCERGADRDVLIAACLLHDIGRREQFADNNLDHAGVGGDKAYDFLISNGYSQEFAERVRGCIVTHRFRKSRPPESLEAKILFDADKLDVTGAMGIARTLVYKGDVGEPLYSLGDDGLPTDGTFDTSPSFFREYKYKLEKLYDKFYTRRGSALAQSRKQAASEFYSAMYAEARAAYGIGKSELEKIIED